MKNQMYCKINVWKYRLDYKFTAKKEANNNMGSELKKEVERIVNH